MPNIFTFGRTDVFQKPLLGTVEQAIAPHQPGKVKFQGTYWYARFYQPDCQANIPPGQTVTVVAREGMTLLVVPSESLQIELTYSNPKVVRSVELTDVRRYHFTPPELEEFESDYETPSPRVVRPTEVSDVRHYQFTRCELEEFESGCEAPLPKVVRPAEVTDVRRYEFTPCELEDFEPDSI